MAIPKVPFVIHTQTQVHIISTLTFQGTDSGLFFPIIIIAPFTYMEPTFIFQKILQLSLDNFGKHKL